VFPQTEVSVLSGLSLGWTTGPGKERKCDVEDLLVKELDGTLQKRFTFL